jgi:hypothetical protein
MRAARRPLAHTGRKALLAGKTARTGRQRGKLRRELFERQDEIEARRNSLIGQLEARLQQWAEERTLLTVEWEMR